MLNVYSSEAELQGACEGIDVQEGVYRFFDKAGRPLEPEFYEPNKKGKISGPIDWVISGKYRLVRPEQSVLSGLKEVLGSVTGLEENPYFSGLEEIQGFLTNQSSTPAKGVGRMRYARRLFLSFGCQHLTN